MTLPGKFMRKEKRGKHVLPCVGASLIATWLAFTPGAWAADSCIQDVWKAHGNTQNLTCTANDVRVARALNPRTLGGEALSSCLAGQTFSFVADFEVVLGAQARYDIGLYFGTDGDANGDGALTGTCTANVIREPYTDVITFGSDNFVQLDPSPPDVCGDIDGVHNPQMVTVRVDNVLCQDTDGNGYLNLPNCTSWRTSGNNEVCDSLVNSDPATFDAYPGSPSKCNCDQAFEVPILVEVGSLDVDKSVYPTSLPQPGGEFTYTVKMTNESQYQTITVMNICDDRYGTIAGSGCAAGTYGSINSTDCAVPQVLDPAGDWYQCTFKADFVSPDYKSASLTDTVTASGKDASNHDVSDSDSAMVQVTNVPPTAQIIKSLAPQDEACAEVIYDVEVTNTSTPLEPIWLHDLTDSAFGSLTSVHDDVLATTCTDLPRQIAAGGDWSCYFKAWVCGGSHTNQVTGTVKDSDNAAINPQSNVLNISLSTTKVTE